MKSICVNCKDEFNPKINDTLKEKLGAQLNVDPSKYCTKCLKDMAEPVERKICPYVMAIAGVSIVCSTSCPFGECVEDIFDDANRKVSREVTLKLTQVIADYLKEQK